MKLSTRETQVAMLVRHGLPNKVIAHELGLDIETVRVYIKRAAAKIPGMANPRHKLTLFILNVVDDVTRKGA